MGLVKRQILIFLLIVFFIGCLHAEKNSHETRKLRSMGMTGNHHSKNNENPACSKKKDCLSYAHCYRGRCICSFEYHGDGKKCTAYPPKSCSSHKDCPGKGKYKQHAKCGVDNKCRCADMYAGNGDYCRPAIKCRHHTCPKNSNCIINPLTPAKQKCVCKEGFYKHRGQCVAGPRSCTTNNCKSPKGVCNNDNVCQCNGPYAGSGDYCRSAKRCPKNNCGENTDCFIDPLFPEKTECRCELGKRKNNAGKCVECLEKDHCSHKPYSICVKGKCTCEDDLVMGKRKCEAGPLHKCKTDKDCNSRAKCEKGNCICQGATVGNGKFCRDGKKCKKNCGYGTCLKDPLMPFDPPAGMCKCDKGYVLNSKTICVECNNNADCGVYATCDKEVCKCKDELKKEKKTCKPVSLHKCKQDNDCHKKAQCILGRCHCGEKTAGNGKFCRDSQQCPAEHKCGGNHTECVVDPLFTDKPVCKCREGFVESADGKCEEVTECSKKNLVCPNDKDCGQLIDGTFGCVCHKGYEMIEGSEICQDIDECSVAEPCSENGVCKNLDGSYECKCNAGYKNNAADKNVCEDWDECYELDNPCSTGEVCENQQGTYTCLCDKGYVKTAVGGCVKEGLMVNISNVFTQELPTTDISSEGSAGCNCKRWEECIEGRCKCRRGYVKNKAGNCVRRSQPGRPGSPGLFPFLFGSSSQHSSHFVAFVSALVLGLLGGLAFTASCTTALGMENGEIKDEQISASSQSSNHARPSLARLNQRKGLGGWCAGKRDENPYLQIDLQRPDTITKVATQGANSNWVEKFSLMFSNDTVHWFDYTVDGLIKIFKGKRSPYRKVWNKLEHPSTARFIRFRPVLDPRIPSCMRIELYGCPSSVDIDECKKTNPCSSNSVCKNLPGGYECICNDGYRHHYLDRNICVDWDECSEMRNPCRKGETCKNQPGTYACLCEEGFVKTDGGCVWPGRDVSSEVCRCKKHWECNEGRCKCKEGYRPCVLCSSHWFGSSLSSCQRTSECPHSWSAWAPKNNRGCCLLCCC
ncbi:uncharacterized protein LOC144658076 [Oculina patagonica]